MGSCWLLSVINDIHRWVARGCLDPLSDSLAVNETCGTVASPPPRPGSSDLSVLEWLKVTCAVFR